jgi:hypothetical protein
MARVEITEQLEAVDLTAADFVLCEEFTSPPAALCPPGATTIGFTLRVAHGEVVVEDRVAGTCDLRLVSDYQEASSIAREPDALAASPDAIHDRIAEGRLSITGNPTDVPTELAGLDIHRLLSSRTA